MHTFEGSRVVGCYLRPWSAFHRAIELLLIRGLALRGGYPAAGALSDGALHHRRDCVFGWQGRAVKGGRQGYWEAERGALRALEAVTPTLSCVSLDVEYYHGRGPLLLSGAL